MLDLSTEKGRIVAAALRLAGERAWADVTLTDIATAADLTLVDLHNAFNSKGDVLAAFVRDVDGEVLARAPQPSPDQSPRDALFEVIMSRFDLLEPYKPALKSISEAWSSDPALLTALANSQAWMLRAAGIAPEGLGGNARILGLGAIYATVFKTWLDDEDPGLARTMAVLDRRLRRGERALKSVEDAAGTLSGVMSFFASQRKKPAPEAQDAPDADGADAPSPSSV